MIEAILAVDDLGGIGKGRTLPWSYNPEDMTRFKTLTSGKTVVMGRNTWNDPLFPKPLKGRRTAVITSSSANLVQSDLCDFILPSALDSTTTEIEKEILLLEDIFNNIVLIGGAKIYNDFLHLAKYIHITRIYGDYNCDTKVNLDILSKYKLIGEREFDNMKFETYLKDNKI